MSETPFPVFRKGEVREEILTYFRNGLRSMINPDTGVAFTEDEIAIATSDVTNWWAEANAIDLVGLAIQSRAIWLADQAWPDRASSDWLRNRHGVQWELVPLPAAGGAGPASGECVAGVTFAGSSEIPSDVADYFVDDAGRRYQVAQSVTTTGTSVRLELKGIDAGPGTNLAAGTKLRPVRAPVGTGDFTVLERFRGGAPAETDAEFARRVLRRMRKRQGAGNWPHLRDLGSNVDGGIADVFIYPCAYHGNSFHAAVVTKRAGVAGPTARIAPAGTVSMVGGILTPPGTREVPGTVHAVVTACVARESEVSLRVDLAAGRASGWRDPAPWPPTRCAWVSEEGPLEYRLTCDEEIDPESAAPSIMAWDAERSRFEVLRVVSWIHYGATPGDIIVTVASAPVMNFIEGVTLISPETARRDDLAVATERYFDSLGPFELVADLRGGRARRQPPASEEWPASYSLSEIASWIKDALGPAVGGRGISHAVDPVNTTEVYPSDPSSGPYLLVLGQLSVHPQE